MTSETHQTGLSAPVYSSPFDSAYFLSQPPELQGLMISTADLVTRENAAAALAAKGFTIDVPIMVYQWNPLLVMQYRASFGYTWVPSALQPNITVAPGVTQPGAVSYDPLHPPLGSLKVSTNPADFPPYALPVQTAPLVTTDLVGPQSLGNMYLTVPGDTSPAGTPWTDSRGKFIKESAQTPFGHSFWWELQAA